MEKLLIVDDNQDIRQQLRWGLAKEYRVLLASDGREALEAFRRERPRVVVLDLGLPPCSGSPLEGFRCLEEMLEINPQAKIIILTGNNEREHAVRAMRTGAFDFYTKPPILNELKVIIGRACHLANIEEQNSPRSADESEQWGMIGSCPEMQAVFSTIRKVAASNAPILIIGENGTGKELVAGAIHKASLRSKGPFITINCGAIPENLLESELFGHEKGAFTGACSTVAGKLTYAHGGTVFLDEIGELPLNMQVKFLRFLQEGTIQRIGGKEETIDSRTTCATNADIVRALIDGRFREDLYYRIGVITIKLPPLRERGADVLLIAESFLLRCARENRKKGLHFSPAGLDFLSRHTWPGNVRELHNRVQRAVIIGEGPSIGPEDLGCDGDTLLRPDPDAKICSLPEAREMLERKMILAAIERESGNILKAAEALGVTRPTLYNLMRKLALVGRVED
jgi:two-component system, NtrC family, response regulator